ncbi:MAG: Sec-independent protein translocase subunit TatA/TatB [Candidatus Thorarchaeota archaeon]
MNTDIVVAYFGMPGQWELLIIAFVAVLIFGRKLPSMARGVGQTIVEFKRGLWEAKKVGQELDQDLKNAGEGNGNI